MEGRVSATPGQSLGLGLGSIEAHPNRQLTVRNTFFDVSDGPTLAEHVRGLRRVSSCPAYETAEEALGEEHLENKPSISKKIFAEESDAAEFTDLAAASRTRLSSNARTFQPKPAVPSTTYYATPPPLYQPRLTGQGLVPAVPVPCLPAVPKLWPPGAFPDQRRESTGARVLVQPGVILGSAALPSLGSGGHATGECKPCVFFHKKGCTNGKTCLFCHLCDKSERRGRQRQNRLAAASAHAGQ